MVHGQWNASVESNSQKEASNRIILNYARRLRCRKLKQLRDSTVIDDDFDIVDLGETDRREYEMLSNEP